MKNYWFIFALLCGVLFFGCENDTHDNSKQDDKEKADVVPTSNAKIVYSFAFIGCNRVDRHDRHKSQATDASSANLAVLQRIFTEVAAEPRQPNILFFLGDLVLAEKDLKRMNKELPAWVAKYKDTDFSPISSTNIELVAIPGNHEMLTYAKRIKSIENGDTIWYEETEWPLQGATDAWLQYMMPYTPADREMVGGPDSLANRLTFSIVRDSIAFVLMNTDTYNPPTTENPWGIEGQVPTKWILNKVNTYKNDPAIRHIFVLGHKPYYVDGLPTTSHKGLPAGPILWPAFQQEGVAAMLSAHKHDYQRVQPGDSATYQVIAGNGGSPGEATFFGWSTINVWSDGRLELVTKGFPVGDPYYAAVPDSVTRVRDQTILTWEKNANRYPLEQW